MLTKRQGKLVNAIVKEYIKTAQPVGSKFLVDTHKLDISSATVRNEMLELDRLGYLLQPHTSAGRIPTETAYQRFLKKSIQKKLSNKQKTGLKQASQQLGADDRQKVKNIAQALAQLSDEFILTAFADNDFYYTGLSHLFSKPEFGDQQIVCNISNVIDHLDARLKKLYGTTSKETEVFVGSKNPIDNNLSLLAVKLPKGPLIALLGPLRMEYRTNIALLEYCKELLG